MLFIYLNGLSFRRFDFVRRFATLKLTKELTRPVGKILPVGKGCKSLSCLVKVSFSGDQPAIIMNASLPEQVPSLVQHLKQAGLDNNQLFEALTMYVDDLRGLIEVDFDHREDPLTYVQVRDYLNALEDILPYFQEREKK